MYQPNLHCKWPSCLPLPGIRNQEIQALGMFFKGTDSED